MSHPKSPCHRRLYPLWTAFLAVPLLTGCGDISLVGPNDFINAVTNFALAPQIPCDQLTEAFGLGHVVTVSDPGAIGLPFEETSVTTAEGETLRVWYVPSDLDRGTIIFSMGAVGDISCYLFITYNLWYNGWSVVLYDFEGFGGSSGEANLFTLRTDLDAVIAWTLEHTNHDQVTLYGVSVGTVPTVAAANAHRDTFNAVILDSSIDIASELNRFTSLLTGPPELFLPLLNEELLLRNTLKELNQPTLAFIYGQDEYDTSAVFPDLVKDTPGEVIVAEFEELGHARGPYLGTAAYFYRVEEFLSDVWSAVPVTTPAEDSAAITAKSSAKKSGSSGK